MKPNVGFEPTTFRFQVDKFAVSILKLAPPDGFEPPNVGIKIRGLTTWRRGYISGSLTLTRTEDLCVINTLL
jgi:hypothetical protein